MSLTLDRKAFIDIIAEGQGDIGGTMLPAARGGVEHAGRDAEDPTRL